MPARKPKTPSGPTPVEAFKHEDKRVNVPPADSEALVSPDVAESRQLRYPRDPDLDPQLVWRGKDEQDAEDLVVDAPPIYIQEKIVPQVIIENLRKVVEKPELTLFDDFDGLEGWEKVEFYEHEANWSNRMILGDSLQVMASLAERESLRGKVQMIYIDPPYGIKFNSNWQTRTDKRDVTDGKLSDVTREVEQIKAFRDTWELGINSYLAYLRERLTVALALLADSGSVFVQIGDENVHLVRSLLDEVFGSENFVSLITFRKTGGATADFLAGTVDYLLWYAKSKPDAKFRRLYKSKEDGAGGAAGYDFVELPSGERRRLGQDQASQQGWRRVQFTTLMSQSQGRDKGEGAASWFPVEISGKEYRPNMQSRWKTNEQGMRRLLAARRVQVQGNSLRYVRYLDDFPCFPITNLWADTFGATNQSYVVQTSTLVIERCVLMSTDPGDLILDPTCGSATTAFVAEQWGRRWITIDTSRVALTLARQRVMGSKFPYFELSDPRGDVRKGFVYRQVPHIMLETIARNPDIRPGMGREEIDAAIARHAESEILYDQPEEDRRKVRVAGPFTVESLSPHRAVAPGRPAEEEAETDDVSAFERTILDNLLKAGVQNGRRNERLQFASLASFPGTYIQAEGERRNGSEGTPQRIAVAIGPQYGTVNPDFIRNAAREAIHGMGFDLLLVCAFSFDPQAVQATGEFAPSDTSNFATVQDERRLGKLPIMLVRMNSDLAMGDVLLKKTGSGNLFMVFGEPDVRITTEGDNDLVVEIKGVDVYNPTTGEIRSSGTGEIALWMIDTDYDGESFFVRHCYFTGDNDPYKRLKAALRADIDEAAWATLYQTKSRPFPRPVSGKIAVKVINHYGDEVLQVYDV